MFKTMKKVLAFFLFLVLQLVSAQNDPTIFTVDNQPVKSKEFTRVYLKNIDLVKDDAQKNLDEYVELYIDYKLKVMQAKALGLDQKPAYINEFSGYKKQLAKHYLTDNQATEKLVKEAYDRSLEEVYVKHILIKVDPNATPQDTLTAYNKIMQFRDEALKKGFDQEMQKVHNGDTVYGEDLGWFSVFRMVYPFESIAYHTSVGEISQPFKTQFGYHILKVINKRKSRGEVEIAHIMIANNNVSSHQTPKERIEEINTLLSQGESFESLAQKFSDDKASAVRGGVLQRFGSGKINSEEFETQAFALHQPGEYSKPFKTDYGWHILKLIKKYPVASYEESKTTIEDKIKKDSRSKNITQTFVDNLTKAYNPMFNQDAEAFVKSVLDESVLNGTWTFEKDRLELQDTYLTIGDEKILVQDFLKFVLGKQRRASSSSVTAFYNEAKEQFLAQHLLAYREKHLEEENEEYAAILNEYRDGLLLFDLMQTEIWDKAKDDSLGLQKFYNKNKSNYLWSKRANAVVATTTTKVNAEKVKELMEAGKSLEEIKAILNPDKKVNAFFTNGKFEYSSNAFPKDFEFVTGTSKIYQEGDNNFTVVQIVELIPESQKALEDAKGKVINDYQQYLEKEWLASLRNGYKIEVNKKALKKLKKELNQ